MNEIILRKTAVLDRIARAAEQANRSPDEITLVAVTKTWPVDVLKAAYEAGLRHFGENRDDELAEKQSAFADWLGEENDVVWHFIGALQSRKARTIADHANVFHALDRIKIVNKLQQRLAENGRLLPTFVEVNISGEMSKSGVDCAAWENDATQRAQLRTMVQRTLDAPNLELYGLMTMAPWEAPEDEIRQVFRRTRTLADWLEETMSLKRPLALSMGMTDDFELAIQEGATHIRVGRALFGERQ